MFGLASISQVPFTTLASGTSVIYLSLTENINVNDTNSQTWSFTQNITENVTMNDFNSQAGIFIGTIVEDFGEIGRAHV